MEGINMNCYFCTATLPRDSREQWLCEIIEGRNACSKCAKAKLKEVRNEKMSVVSSCPHCGAPIYGRFIVNAYDKIVCSYSCSCRIYPRLNFKDV